MPTIRVFTLSDCPNCPKAKQIARAVAEKHGAEYEEIDIEADQITALQYQVMSTPSIAIDEDTLYFGDVPSEDELSEALRRYL